MASNEIQTLSVNLDAAGTEKGVKALTASLGGLKKTLGSLGTAIFKTFSEDSITDFMAEAEKGADRLSSRLLQLQMEFGKLKAAIGDAAAPIVQAFLPGLDQAVQGATRFVKSAGAVIAALLGGIAGTEALAESADNAASAEKALTKTSTAAGKAVKRALAGFDELEILKFSSGSGSEPAVEEQASLPAVQVPNTLTPALQAAVDPLLSWIEPLKNIDLSPVNAALDRLKEALKPITRTLFEGLEWAWYNLLTPLAAWTIEDALPAFLDVLSSGLAILGSVIEALRPLGDWLWKAFLQPLANWASGVIVDTIHGLADGLSKVYQHISDSQEGVRNLAIFLGSIVASFAGFSAISGVIAYIGAVAALAPEVGLLAAMFPKLSSAIATVGAWITGTFLPAITGALGAIAGALGISVGWVAAIAVAVGAAVAAIIIYWDEIVAAAASAWESVKQVWSVVSGWFHENVAQPVASFFSSLWDGLSAAASTCWAAIAASFAPAIAWFSGLLSSIWQTWRDLFHNIGVIASGCWEMMKAVWAVVSQWFDTRVIQPVSAFFKNLWDGFLSGAKAAWEGVKSVFGAAAAFFGGVFSEAWAAVVKVFSVAGDIFVDIQDGIVTVFKTVVNGIIQGINSVVAIPFNGINSALESLRDMNLLGLTPFSGLKTISVPQIPYLAQGAVLPANKPFLAMVGDQPRGTNVEAPLATIQEAVAAVLAEGQADQTALLRQILQAVLGIEVGDTVIGQAAERYRRKMAVVTGGIL